MDEIMHFSHQHPLSLFPDTEVDDYEDQKLEICKICRLPILSSPYYACTMNPNCHHLIHKSCAGLPRQLKHPLHRHELEFGSGKYMCRDEKWCSGFDIHPLLAAPVEIKSKHKSHKSHPLFANGRVTLSLCDGCGEEHKGFFFSCRECNFWIHQNCTLLPTFVKLPCHSHPFILTYSLPPHEPYGREGERCVICRKARGAFYNGVYFCGQCNVFAHAACARSNMEHPSSQVRLELVQLPADEQCDTVPSFIIRRLLETITPIPHQSNLKTDHHDHTLTFHDGSVGRHEACRSPVCDLCTKHITISSSFYKCLEPTCNFFTHIICKNLPSTGKINPETKYMFEARFYPDTSKDYFNSIFSCYYCHRPSNGSCYRTITENFCYFVDLECACAPNSIKHASHGQHVLFRTTYPSWSDIDLNPLSCCSAECRDYYDAYRCIGCNFYIHVGCALLPKRTHHKFDEHPLELITTRAQVHHQDHYCEVCEKDIDCRFWYYGCGQCEQSFHIKCIPSVGILSKVKFGKKLCDDKIHQHPVTLTRMLTVGRNETCGHCKKIIRGFEDTMTFHCYECWFWIHFTCARDCSCPTLLIPSKYWIENY